MNPRHVLVLIALLSALRSPAIAQPLTIALDPGAAGPGKFAAGEIRREAGAQGMTLGDALAHWKRYAALRDACYDPALYNRVSQVHVTELTEKVAADLDLARDWRPGTLKGDGRRSGTERGFRK